MQEMTLTLAVSVALVSEAQVPGLRSVDAVEGAKCQQQAARQLLELLNSVAHDAPGKSRK